MQLPDLRAVLAPLPWAVAGALAARLYMPERATRDVDIVIRKQDREVAEHKFTGAGFTYQGRLGIGGSAWVSRDGVPVDLVELDEPWAATALAEAQQNRDAQGAPVLPFRFLVLMKFQAGRVQDLADITRMLGQASEEMLSAVRGLFESYRPEDLSDLESLISLGQMEVEAEGHGEGSGPS